MLICFIRDGIYLQVRFAGQKQKTQSKRSVQNPAFYEMLEFHQMHPEDLQLAPHVLIQVWDNKVGDNYISLYLLVVIKFEFVLFLADL